MWWRKFKFKLRFFRDKYLGKIVLIIVLIVLAAIFFLVFSFGPEKLIEVWNEFRTPGRCMYVEGRQIC